jgi:hypothetical protein
LHLYNGDNVEGGGGEEEQKEHTVLSQIRENPRVYFELKLRGDNRTKDIVGRRSYSFRPMILLMGAAELS